MLLSDILAMSSPLRLATIATITSLLFAQPSTQQTYTKCDPLQQSCSPDPALGRSVYVDFTQGSSSEFTNEGNPTFNSNGAAFTVAQGGDAPQVISNWYIMFGKYEVTMKAAPGVGIVSSLVLQSDDLDEIDWEWIGGQNDQVQTNYFGKGETLTYDRSTTVTIDNTQGEWHTYAVEWTSEQIVWSIDGNTVRTLTAGDADPGQYPQTPCNLRIGSWSGGDPSNPPGTIAWAGGPTDYSQGPFTMYVKSVSVTDYSTGSQYKYGDQSGDWTSIEAVGGKVNGNINGAMAGSASPAAPAPTASGSAAPFYQPSASATLTYTTYPGLPSGWSVNPTSGKVVPPSSAAPSTSQPALSISTSQPAVSPAASSGACEYKTVKGYNEQGFPITETVPVGAKTSWNDKGLPVTVYPKDCSVNTVALQNKAVATPTATVIGTKGDFTTISPLPTDDSIHTKAKVKGKSGSTHESAASTVAARFCAAFGIFLSAILFLA